MIDELGTIQVNAAIDYLENRKQWKLHYWVIDWKSCRFYERLFSGKRHTYSNIV